MGDVEGSDMWCGSEKEAAGDGGYKGSAVGGSRRQSTKTIWFKNVVMEPSTLLIKISLFNKEINREADQKWFGF